MDRKHAASSFLFLCLAFSAFRASADGAFMVGSNAGFDDINLVPDDLATVFVSEPAGTTAVGAGTTWNCAVTCSAELAVVAGGNTGTATLSIRDDAVTVAGSQRTFNILQSPKEISTTIRTTMVDSSDPDTMSCAAQEIGVTDIAANDSSITVVCTDLP